MISEPEWGSVDMHTLPKVTTYRGLLSVRNHSSRSWHCWCLDGYFMVVAPYFLWWARHPNFLWISNSFYSLFQMRCFSMGYMYTTCTLRENTNATTLQPSEWYGSGHWQVACLPLHHKARDRQCISFYHSMHCCVFIPNCGQNIVTLLCTFCPWH
jgi:hypothetical protein